MKMILHVFSTVQFNLAKEEREDCLCCNITGSILINGRINGKINCLDSSKKSQIFKNSSVSFPVGMMPSWAKCCLENYFDNLLIIVFILMLSNNASEMKYIVLYF